MMRSILCVLVLAALLMSGGCFSQPANEVIVYCALDQEFAEPILKEFEAETGTVVRAKYDLESTKTVGLFNAILQERARPRCDLFWNNEIMHTIRLQDAGLLAPFDPAAKLAGQTVPQFTASAGTYYGFAARARVLLVNTELVSESRLPTSIQDLIDPQWKNKVAIAKPLFGTTASHAAVLWHTWGKEAAQEYFTKLQANARVLSGNKQVAQEVGRGALAFGLTDTDDAVSELEAGRPVKIVFPDQGADQMGTLFIPNTVCILKDAPHQAAAKQLADKILSADTEGKLAKGPSAQIPILKAGAGATKVRSRAEPAELVRAAEVDFAAAAQQWEEIAGWLTEVFTK